MGCVNAKYEAKIAEVTKRAELAERQKVRLEINLKKAKDQNQLSKKDLEKLDEQHREKINLVKQSETDKVIKVGKDIKMLITKIADKNNLKTDEDEIKNLSVNIFEEPKRKAMMQMLSKILDKINPNNTQQVQQLKVNINTLQNQQNQYQQKIQESQIKILDISEEKNKTKISQQRQINRSGQET